jgi:predicted DCC family thiol-disulfide oxidoreductase YuxK
VLYNGECPICSREIRSYEAQAERAGRPIAFDALGSEEAERWGIGRDAAARRLHVRRGGETLEGLDAFVALWEELPRLRWLARAVSLPGLRPLVEVIYERAAAPLLYAMDRRRRRRGGTG